MASAGDAVLLVEHVHHARVNAARRGEAELARAAHDLAEGSRSLKSATVPMKPSGRMPAARAAMIIVCFGACSVSPIGSMPTDSAKSSAPSDKATSRGVALAISRTRK